MRSGYQAEGPGHHHVAIGHGHIVTHACGHPSIGPCYRHESEDSIAGVIRVDVGSVAVVRVYLIVGQGPFPQRINVSPIRTVENDNANRNYSTNSRTSN